MSSTIVFFRKSVLIGLIICLISSFGFAEKMTANEIISNARKKTTLDESLKYLIQNAEKPDNNDDIIEIWLTVAAIEEQLSDFEEAIIYYNCALSRKSDENDSCEKIKLSIVRCALCMGDTNLAESYLFSLCNSKDVKISNYGKLYSQWNTLCKAEKQADVQESIELLKAYLNINTMKPVHPAVLLTLWYVTGSETWANKIKSDFKNSPEAAIVNGDIQLLPVPFWFFVPKSGNVEQGTGTYEAQTIKAGEESKIEESKSKFSNWQLGLFKSKENAEILCKEVKNLGFEGYITSETRASGTTYYIVLVKDDKTGQTADKLRNAGYECYPVE